MSRQSYVFELQFKAKGDGSDNRENQFVILDRESIASFSNLREDLSKCLSEPFQVQYLDDEEDIVSIDTEEEFREFAKLALQRSSRGMLIKVILNTNALDHSNYWQLPTNSKNEDQLIDSIKQIDSLAKMREKFKTEIKNEILAELKDELVATNCLNKEVREFEEDSDGNVVIHEKRRKFVHQLKKLEKKDKNTEYKIDQRLEKLESKKKKASMRLIGTKKCVFDPKLGVPFIMSGIATLDSSILAKKVNIGKMFIHVWNVINDGTVAWVNVELRHIWSSPGLEHEESTIKCQPLMQGQEGNLAMKFKAPKTVGTFLSYWNLFHKVDSQWQQFGHYISLTGTTKLSKLAIAAAAAAASGQVQDGCKNSKIAKFVVLSAKDVATDKPINGKKEPKKVQNDEPRVSFESKMAATTKELLSSMASAQIAAEMTREALNAAHRRSIGKQTSTLKSTTTIQLLDELLNGVETLNLGDSGSDNDVNLDTNEETDPDFVMVNIPVPSCSGIDTLKPPVHTSQEKIIEPSKFEIDGTNEINEIFGKDTSSSLPVNTSENKEETECMTVKNSVYLSRGNNNANEMKRPQHTCAYYNSHEKQENFQQTSFPRLDPNINYPVFPQPRVAMPMYPPQNSLPQHYPHAYSVFPPQNSTSHAIVFPPPPSSYYNAPKINPPVHYHTQIPTYPPMPGSSPHMPLLSSVLSPSSAIPVPSTMAPSQTIPPQMNPTSMLPFPMNTVLNYGTRAVPSSSETEVFTFSKSTSTAPISSSSVHQVNELASKTTCENTPHAAENKMEGLSASATPDMPSQIAGKRDENKPEPAQKNKKADSSVQILPQALVDGAIHVATSAYSSACTALNNLRPKEGIEVEFDPVLENNMTLLVEMGFNNVERNGRLLKRFNNDVNQVIGAICSGGDGNNLDID